MENLGDNLHGKGFAAMWSCMGPLKPLQLISTADIGHFASRALLEPANPDFHNSAIFRKARGAGKRGLPKAPAVVGTLVKWNTPEIKAMFRWFEEEGFKADIGECRRVWPGLKGFEEWCVETGVFGK